MSVYGLNLKINLWSNLDSCKIIFPKFMLEKTSCLSLFPFSLPAGLSVFIYYYYFIFSLSLSLSLSHTHTLFSFDISFNCPIFFKYLSRFLSVIIWSTIFFLLKTSRRVILVYHKIEFLRLLIENLKMELTNSEIYVTDLVEVNRTSSMAKSVLR